MENMNDKKEIERRLEHIDLRLARLKERATVDYQTFSSDSKLREVIYRQLQIALQACADITQIIGCNDKPTYFRNLNALVKQGIITKELADKLEEAETIRIDLIHNYLTTDMRKIYDYIQNNLTDITDFSLAITKYTGK